MIAQSGNTIWLVMYSGFAVKVRFIRGPITEKYLSNSA